MKSTYKLPTTTYKLLAIIGPTASGKSEFAVKLAKRFNGEIVSADSRQIYHGMDLGTGKVPGKWSIPKIGGRQKWGYWYKGIRHHGIDTINPKAQYSAALFQRDAKKIIADILKRGKLPIICGGTAQWVDAVVYNMPIPDVKPNLKLRFKLEKKSLLDLYRQLKKLDPVRAKTIDPKNKRRLIRALEIVITTGKPVPSLQTTNYHLQTYPTLWLGIKPPQNALYKKIDLRLKQRLRSGMLKEVLRLHKNGLSWKKLESFGLEYKYLSLHLQKKLPYPEMLTQLSFAIKHYSKRQLTWWKRNKEIKWVDKQTVAIKLVEKFLQ